MLGLVVAGGGAGVAEVQEHVDLVVSDTGSDLLLAALLTREQTLDIQSGRFGNVLGGNAGRTQIMLAQNTAVGDTELSHQFFFQVMCNDRNLHSKPLFSYFGLVSCGKNTTPTFAYTVLYHIHPRFVNDILKIFLKTFEFCVFHGLFLDKKSV